MSFAWIVGVALKTYWVEYSLLEPPVFCVIRKMT